MSLLDHYTQVCSAAMVQPSDELIKLISAQKAPSEVTTPFTTIDADIHLFGQIIQYLKELNQPDSPQKIQRATQILQILNSIKEELTQIPASAAAITTLLQNLKQQNYTRYKKFLPILTYNINNYLTTFLNQQTPQELLVLAKAPLELLFSHLKDPHLQQLIQTDDLVNRLKTLQNVAETAQALHKLTGTNFSPLKPGIFTISKSEFDAEIQTISANFQAAELVCATILEQIFNQLKFDSIPLLTEFRGVLKRKNVKQALISIQQPLNEICEAFLDKIDDFLLRNSTDITKNIIFLRNLRASASQFYQAAQLLNDNLALTARFKEAADRLKSKEIALVKEAKKLISALCGNVKSGRKLLEFDEKKRLSVDFSIAEIVEIYALMQNFGYLPQLALPNDVVSVVQTGLGVSPALQKLRDVAAYYNDLVTTVKSYQKPLLMSAAAQFESELQKASQSSQFLLGNGQKDAATVERVRGVANAIYAVKEAFSRKIDLVADFHSSNEQILRFLVNIPLSHRQIWKEKVFQMRQNIAQFIPQVPQTFQDTLLQYWNSALSAVMAVKYQQSLTGNLSQIRPMQPLILTTKIELFPQLFDVKNYLFDQIQQIALFPLDSAFYLSENPKITQMFPKMAEMSISALPEAFKTVDSVVRNLRAVVEFVQNECGSVRLANSGDLKLFSEKLSLQDAQRVYDASCGEAQAEDPVLALRSQFPFLVEKTNEKGIFSVEPSGGTISLDMATVVRVINQKQLALQEIAIGAAGYHLGEISAEVIAEIDLVFAKVERGLQDAKTAEELSAITKFFAQVETLAKTHLKSKIATLNEFKTLISTRDEILRNVDACTAKFNSLVTALSNVSGTLENKKNEMWEGFKSALLQEIAKAARADEQLESAIYEVIGYFEQNVVVRQPPVAEGANLPFVNLPTQKLTIGVFAVKIAQFDADLTNLSLSIQKVDEEVKVLYNTSHTALLTQEQFEKSQNLLEKQKLSSFIHEKLSISTALEAAFSGILNLDWSILRVKTHFQDEIQRLFGEIQPQNSFLPQFDVVKRFCQTQFLHANFVNKLAQASLQIIKSLKSPALAKSHWHEISDKTNVISAIKFFQNVNSVALPDQLDGTSLFYTIAVNLFPSAAAVVSEVPSVEFKRFQLNIREIVAKAEAELSVRAAVDEVTFYVQNEAKLMFGMLEMSDLSIQEVQSSFKCIPLTAVWKPVLVAITEKKAILQSVLTNPFSKFIKDQIDQNSRQMEEITRLAYVLLALQRQILVIEPVMGRRVLPDQHDKFYKALRVISHVLIQASPASERALLNDETRQIEIPVISFLSVEIPKQIQLSAPSSVISQIELAQQILNECQSALRKYLEAKRLSFPKFYFLADQDVLEILANANAKPEKTLQNHVKKLFSAVEKLIFSGNKIVGLESSETEKIMLKQDIQIKDAPEVWLKRLDLSIKETLKAELMTSLKLTWKVHDVNQMHENDEFEVNTSYQEVKNDGEKTQWLGFSQLTEAVKSNLDMKNTSAEILTVIFGVVFTTQVDYAFQNPEKTDSLLEKVKTRLDTYLSAFTTKLFAPEISTATFGTENFVMNLKLKALSTDATHYLTLINDLLSSKNRLWEWNKSLKYRIHEKSLDLYIVGLDTNLPYTFEYQGIYQRLIHTPLTDRCFSTLVSALSVSVSSNPQGPAGTGKTETVKAFACKLARTCIVFNCDSAIDRENLSRILIGIVLSGSVGCFDEVNRLSPAVLSAVSTDIENIQIAIQNKSLGKNSGHLQLSDIKVPITKVSAFSAVFVTMNPASREYRGRSELPFSLIKLLRGCFMGKADVNLIMETILSTSGFKFAKIWAEKVDLTYALASRRIPKEVHLDWGLRSLQAVLRQSALARAGKFRKISENLTDVDIQKIEKEVVIKALSDATFSRVQGRSADIFKEILGDVFGALDTQKGAKFGAASDIENKLAEFVDTDSERIGSLVLQLYRALTAKVGVSLLGSTASGKTTIWELLKKAVNLASDGKIEMQEYRIAPKAMSRQDLLGYVDPVSKEWTDGALSKAARQAVASLTTGMVWPVLVFDGDIDPAWIEALNSSLDDNRLLSLSSGERIRFPMSLDPLEAYFTSKTSNIPMPVSFLFETDSLEHASPATVSRLAVILVSDPPIEEQKILLNQLNPGLSEALDLLIKQNPPNLPVLTTHMHYAGLGELAMNHKSDYVIGALRTLSTELPQELTELNYKQLSQAIGQTEIALKQHNISPKHVDATENLPDQQIYATNLAQTYLQNNTSVIISGPQDSAKFHISHLSGQFRDQYKTLVLACTNLTSRDDILRILLSETAETQRIDGHKELHPKNNKKLLLIVRNADILKLDEYGHSEVFTLLWALLAHSKIFVKGTPVFVKNVLFVLTLKSAESVPLRLARRAGHVRMRNLTQSDAKIVLGNAFGVYAKFADQRSLERYVQGQITHFEALEIQLRQQRAKSVICLPNFYQNLAVSFTSFLAFSQLELADSEQIYALLEVVIAGKQPFWKGREAALTDITKISTCTESVFTVCRMTQTAQQVQRLLLQDEPIQMILALEFVSLKVRLNMLEELINATSQYYPALVLFGRFLRNLDDLQLKSFLKTLQTLEISLFLKKSVVLITQSNNFSAEALTISALTLGLKIHFQAPEKLNLRQLGEQVARNFRILLVLDENVLDFDAQFLVLISAISARDVSFLRAQFSVSELRNLLGIYAESCENPEENEAKQIENLFNSFVENVQICVILAPERPILDQIFASAPVLRRNFGVCAFQIQENATLNSDIVPVYKSLNAAFAPIHTPIFNFTSKFMRQNGPNFTIPNAVFIKSYCLFTVFKESWQATVNQRKNQLFSGLNQLNSAQSEIDKLRQQAQISLKSVEKAQAQANAALEDITKKMEIVQRNKENAGKMKAELAEKSISVTKQKQDAEASLGSVLPILEEATKAVQSIPNDALTEVKSFKQPPQAVATVLEAVLTFMGNSDISWQGMRAFLSQSGVLRQIASFDVKKVPSNQLKKVIQIVKQKPEAFEQERIQKVSKAAAPLAKWVSASLSYSEVFVKIEPLMKAAENAASSLISLQNELEKTENEVVQLEKDTEILRENFNEKTQELMKWKTEFQSIEVKKKRGEDMLENLKNEKIRWSENLDQIQIQLTKIDKCAILNAVMFTICGNKTDDIRQHLCGEYRKLIFDLQINQQFIDQTVQSGLFYSNQALENVALLSQFDQNKQLNTIIFSYVTDSTGLLTYIKNTYSKAQFVSATSENLQNLIQIAARFGQKIVITDCDQGSIPPELVPYIRYGTQAYKCADSAAPPSDDLLATNQTLLVPQNSKLTEMSPDFSAFVVSRVGLHVEENLQNKVLEMSFAPTNESRNELYIKIILNEWSPETVKKLTDLDTVQADLRGKLFVIEQELLTALEGSKSAPNILEDQNLIKVLEKAKNQTLQIQTAQIEAQNTQKQLNLLREKASKIAGYVGRSVAALEKIQHLNDLYVTDDSAIIPLLKQVLIQLNPKTVEIQDSTVNLTIREYFIIIYNRIQQMVFQSDKTGAIAILYNNYYPDLLSNEIYAFLAGIQPTVKQQNLTWAGSFQAEISSLLSILSPEKLKTLKIDQAQIWGSFVQKAGNCKFYGEALPQNCADLTEFEKLAFLICVRPDLLNSNLQFAADQHLISTLQIQKNPIVQAVELADSIAQPILIFTSSGNDPTSAISAEIVALSPGREMESNAQFSALLASELPPKLIIFKGAHLCPNWLQNLPSFLNSVQNCASTRVILLLEPKGDFPKNLMGVGWRICLSGVMSAKEGMMGRIGGIMGCKSNIKRCLAYMVSVFQVILEGRKNYQPRGVSADPGWSGTDSDVMVTILSKLEENGDIVKKVKGYLNDCIYGVQTKEAADLTLIRQLANIAFSPSIEAQIVKFTQNCPKVTKTIKDTFQLVSDDSKLVKQADYFPFIKYLIPPFAILQSNKEHDLVAYISDNFPNSPTSDLLGLQSNALLIKGEKDSMLVKSILARTISSSSEENGDSGVFEAILKLKNIFNEKTQNELSLTLEGIQGVQQLTKTSAISEELIEQSMVIQKLQKIITQDFDSAQIASENYLFATPEIKQIAQLISSGIVPESWSMFIQSPPCSIAPPDAPELVTLNQGNPNGFLQFLVDSAKAILGGLNSCVESEKSASPINIDLEFIPRPTSLVEAVRRYEGQINKIELDKVRLVASTIKESGPRVCISKGSIKLVGAGYGAGLDFNQNEMKLCQIWLVSSCQGKEVPFYVDKSRSMRMAVVENLIVEANDGTQVFVDVYGVYACLDGR
ncbi:Dynein heavy chain [Spironucleus salmonicida]|uniref:Dynein heavy chain n=1 Tax=Spironucleus salmonicida TaxID=348837 RepID=V6M6R8_9EUKA|nr:Dynein heavy chain [Spironucleus salmonicida]|eukprot:EST49114.1 Dynein heavy chain [Spironucleus salmonicida]